MAWFRKPKNLEPATPQLCCVCRGRLGTIPLDVLPRSAQLALGDDALGDHAWLCVPCAQRFGHDEPPSS